MQNHKLLFIEGAEYKELVIRAESLEWFLEHYKGQIYAYPKTNEPTTGYIGTHNDGHTGSTKAALNNFGNIARNKNKRFER